MTTLLKLQHIMSNEIAKRAFFSRPPDPPASVLMGDPLDSIYIGNTMIFKVPFTWTFMNITNPHIAVVGITGAGKSYFVKTLLVRANYIWNTNAIIIDFAGEYKAWVKQSGGIVVALGKGDHLNLMDLAAMKPLDRAKQIMTSFEILTDISMYPEQKRLTQEAVEQAYLNFGFSLYEIPPREKEVHTLHDVIALLQEKLQEGTYEYPAELENALFRLRQFARTGEDYFASKSTVDIGKLSRSGLVAIDLSGMGDDKFRAMAALFILQTLKEYMRSESWSATKGHKALVVLDEAWKVASDDKSDAILIVREGRKFHFGLIVASQNPTDINEAIFSNVGTTFILRIKFERFMSYLQGSLNFSGFIKSEIGKFGVGQAAVDMAFQTALRFPGIFLLDKIYGEEPLYVYTIDAAELEVDANNMQTSYQMERDELRNRLLEYNVNNDTINEIFTTMDNQGRKIGLRDFILILKKSEINVVNTVAFLKSLGIDDQHITKVISHIGL